jgi:hypothetical protein
MGKSPIILSSPLQKDIPLRRRPDSNLYRLHVGPKLDRFATLAMTALLFEN